MGKHKALTAAQHLQRGKDIRVALAGLGSIEVLDISPAISGAAGDLYYKLNKIRCEADSVVCSVLKNDDIDPKRLGVRVYYGEILDDVEGQEFIDLWFQLELAK